MDLVHEKRKRLEKLCNKESIFSALAIDQRGALKKDDCRDKRGAGK